MTKKKNKKNEFEGVCPTDRMVCPYCKKQFALQTFPYDPENCAEEDEYFGL